jgi:membrane protease YdiL (CAAX protease family)
MLKSRGLPIFAALVVGLTLLVAVANLGREAAPFALVFVPLVAALVTAGLTEGRGGVARILRRMGHVRVSPRWYAAAVGVPVLMWLGVVAAAVATGTPTSGLFQNLGEIPTVFLVVFIPAVIEELGWRGYALPVALRSWPVLGAALVVGVLFIVPHLALYLPGGLYDNLPLWPVALILLSYGVLLAWVFVGSGGSALVAALMHAAFNGLTPLSRGIDPVIEWQLHGVVATVLAVIVVAATPWLRRPVPRPAPASSQVLVVEVGA